METFMTIVAVVEGVIIGALSLLNWQRTRQVKEERRKTVREQARRITAENKAENAVLELKRFKNKEHAEGMTDDEATDALNDGLARLRSDDDGSGGSDQD